MFPVRITAFSNQPAMKNYTTSVRAALQAVLAIALFAMGANRLAAQVDPMTAHTSSENEPQGRTGGGIPCAFCADPR